ncbi:hypothetical protein [Bradyrhizobium japonicum]|uniref:hypothetical protein n=1 Tax=Bradyrhizobium japonicum TaxID=375 RepID=UPI0012DB2F12|nr:hypothetical protein [Bradyrhizobium japonicum]
MLQIVIEFSEGIERIPNDVLTAGQLDTSSRGYRSAVFAVMQAAPTRPRYWIALRAQTRP